MKRTERQRRLLSLSIAGILGFFAVVMAQANAEASGLESAYRSSIHQISLDMAQATGQGYTSDDLAPISAKLAEIQAAPEPIWVGDRPGFYRQQGLAASSLHGDLNRLEVSIGDDAKAKLGQTLSDTAAKIAQDHQLQVDDADVAPLQTRLDELNKTAAAASKITDYRSLVVEAGKVQASAAQLAQAQIDENNAIQQLADQIKAQANGNLDAIRKAAQKILRDARDDATVEGFLAMRNHFNNPATVMKPLAKMEKFVGQLGDGNLDKAAFAGAAIQRYGGQVHDAATKGMPAKTLVVYIQDQYLIAYDHGNQAMGTVVTTGRPSLPTDVGPMKIIYRQSPFVMRSPWPKTSPFWYPDSPVRKVMWFTETGEGLHDAPWRGDYGAGTNVYDGTHGCINLPGDRVDWVWDWAPDGTDVIVIPGTGETQASQLAQDSIDTPAGSVIKGA